MDKWDLGELASPGWSVMWPAATPIKRFTCTVPVGWNWEERRGEEGERAISSSVPQKLSRRVAHCNAQSVSLYYLEVYQYKFRDSEKLTVAQPVNKLAVIYVTRHLTSSSAEGIQSTFSHTVPLG